MIKSAEPRTSSRKARKSSKKNLITKKHWLSENEVAWTWRLCTAKLIVALRIAIMIMDITITAAWKMPLQILPHNHCRNKHPCQYDQDSNCSRLLMVTRTIMIELVNKKIMQCMVTNFQSHIHEARVGHWVTLAQSHSPHIWVANDPSIITILILALATSLHVHASGICCTPRMIMMNQLVHALTKDETLFATYVAIGSKKSKKRCNASK